MTQLSATLDAPPAADASSDVEPEPTRRCRKCRQPRPLSQFRPRENGKTHSACNFCHALSMAARREKKRSRAVRSFISHASREQNHARLETLLANMFDNFNGVEGLTKVWRRENALAETQPDSPRVGRSIMAYVKLMIYADKTKPPEPSLDHVSEEELAELLALEARRELARIITEHPDLWSDRHSADRRYGRGSQRRGRPYRPPTSSRGRWPVLTLGTV
jgi:hypothetical protein